MPELDDVGRHLELFRKAIQAALGDLHQAVLHLLDEGAVAAVDPQTLRALVAVCHLQEGGLALRGLLLLPVLQGLGQLTQPVEVGLASEQPGFLEVIGKHQLAHAQEVQNMPKDGPVAVDEGVAHGVHMHHGLLPHDYLFQQRAGMLGQGMALRGIQVEYEKRKKEEAKCARADKQKVLEVLFSAFEKHQYYNIRDLVDITKQPLVDLLVL
uniref:TFIIF beta subunit HTH domain-containing protein n=1 Tax=Cyprinus carpio carpio TaxID=630221 RepID=A0A9J7ZUQ1_CYPCA